MSIVYVSAGAWGAGKGSVLTKAELDNNFYEVSLALDAAEAAQNIPLYIADIIFDVNSGWLGFFSQGTAHKLLGQIPAPFADTFLRYGYYQNSVYGENSIVLTEDSMHLVLQEHTAGAAPDWDYEDTSGARFFRMWGTAEDIWDIPIYLPGHPGEGMAAGVPIATARASRAGTLLGGVVAARSITGELEAEVYVNSTSIGSVHLGGTIGEVVSITEWALAAGDTVSLMGFDLPENAEGVSITFQVQYDGA